MKTWHINVSQFYYNPMKYYLAVQKQKAKNHNEQMNRMYCIEYNAQNNGLLMFLWYQCYVL